VGHAAAPEARQPEEGAQGAVTCLCACPPVVCASIPPTPAVELPGCEGERAPGDFEFGATFKPTDEKELERKQLAELKNGRLAMPAFSGQVTQAVLTGHDAPFLW
jgi:hypothetical protein